MLIGINATVGLDDVRANFFLDSLKSTMIGQMATALALNGLNDLGRSVTPVFVLIDHFLDRFLRTQKNVLQNAPSNPVRTILFSSSFICTTVSKAS